MLEDLKELVSQNKIEEDDNMPRIPVTEKGKRIWNSSY